MSKPVLLSGGNGKVQELAGSNNDDVLTWDSALDGGSWKSAPNGSGVVTMGGDVTGSSDDATVAKIQNIPISTTDPTVGKILQYTGTEWAPADAPLGGSGGGGVLYYLNKSTPVTGGNLPANTYQLGRTAEATQSSVALTNLATESWTRVGGFVTDAGDPSVTTVPAGLWDFNFWAETTAAANNQAYVRFTLYAYNGSTNPEAGTVLAQTDNIYLYDANVIAQYIAAMLIDAGTTLPSTSTRLYLLIEARASTSNRDLTMYFGNETPSHTHSTIPSVGGTGLVHVIDGVFQSPATAVGLGSSDVSGTLPATNGGTGQSSYAVGDLLYASTTSALSRLADVATGNALISGGVGVAPSWGKIGLTTHVSGTLPVANGGTGASSRTQYGVLVGAVTSAVQVTGAGTTGQYLKSGNNAANPSFATIDVGEVTGAAPLASPTFTGTPSLPTGTTGVTQSAGNNTTALATTAFVTTAVATSSGAPYDLPCEIPGTPPTSTKVVNFEAVRAFVLATTGHQGGQITAPSGNFVCTVRKNATTIGTITFGTLSFSTNITGTLAERTFAATDVLSVETQATDLGIDTPFFTLLMTLA